MLKAQTPWTNGAAAAFQGDCALARRPGLIRWTGPADNIPQRSAGALLRSVVARLVDFPRGNREGLIAYVDPTSDCAVTAPKHCAYNQTSECFLGLDVDAADFSRALLSDRIPALTPESGAGLWMIPFRGILAEQVPVPLDLVYLDDECRVIDVVESFPRAQTSSRRPAASVLALPANSIQLSQTKPGDQLVLCAANEMATRLNQVHIHRGIQGHPEKSGTMEEPIPADRRAAPQPEGWREPDVALEPPPSAVQPEPTKKKKLRNWLERFLAPEQPKEPSDSRRAPRKRVRGVFAFYWTGATPVPHAIRDISASGLYLVTEERWYPETMVRLTLTKTDDRGIERSLSVQARVVRWGNDGVGLQFVTGGGSNGAVEAEGANREQLDEFLRWIGKGGTPDTVQ